ncbi:MAG: DNA-directed RNA polymerase subunit beta, partial [Candidatus Omnitrophica bacterium]|nr:DNA-directed RNA polymerase subunit beta [Candidatus Omnitrophota bacterium]
LRAIFGKRAEDVRDISLRASPGTQGTVVDVKVLSRKTRGSSGSRQEEEQTINRLNRERDSLLERLHTQWEDAIREFIDGETLTADLAHPESGSIVLKGGTELTDSQMKKLEGIQLADAEIPLEKEGDLRRLNRQFHHRREEIDQEYDKQIDYIKTGDNLPPGVIKMVKVYIAKTKKLSVGDKMAGRHGNKGVVSRVLPMEDMPHLEDGTPVDIVLNPLGVPSRMNVGQILETHLGWACHVLGMHAATPVFDGIPEAKIWDAMRQADLPGTGKTKLYDGRTGDQFDQEVVVGMIYMLKLHHLVSDKIHARAVGPYSLVTQQPLGGKAQYGGQRFGEMEVWALEAYGAAYSLQEILTVKSDDIAGRTRIYESIVKGENVLEAGRPESFNVLMKEMQSLGLDIRVHKAED